jgi:glycosyltransferase involved in cell wall biosynthesis
MSPAVSIGMPVYNGQDFLEDAINSILVQSFEDFELIICDNASTDDTERICSEFAARDRRITYYRNESNIGAAANYNRLFELSSGKYFKWAAHDDLCAPDYLAKCVEVLDNCDSNIVLCFPQTTLIDENGNFISRYNEDVQIRQSTPYLRLSYLLRNLKKCNSVHSLIRSKALKSTRLIRNFFASDVVLLAELAMQGQFYFIPENLFFRRMHHASSRRANRTYEEVAIWFDPNNKGRIILPMCTVFEELLKAVKCSELNRKDRTFCYTAVIEQWLNRYWRVMGGELKLGLKQLIRRTSSVNACIKQLDEDKGQTVDAGVSVK